MDASLGTVEVIEFEEGWPTGLTMSCDRSIGFENVSQSPFEWLEVSDAADQNRPQNC
jgi:hypothetical protein